MHQQARVARQGGGVAADVDDALGRLPGFGAGRQRLGVFGADACLMDGGQCLHQREGAFAGRVDQPTVGRAVGHQLRSGHVEQVARYKFGSCQRLSSGR